MEIAGAAAKGKGKVGSVDTDGESSAVFSPTRVDRLGDSEMVKVLTLFESHIKYRQY